MLSDGTIHHPLRRLTTAYGARLFLLVTLSWVLTDRVESHRNGLARLLQPETPLTHQQLRPKKHLETANTDDIESQVGINEDDDGEIKELVALSVNRRYWGDELSACIELHCMALSNDGSLSDQYVACLIANCPEAIVHMGTQESAQPLFIDEW